MLAENLPNLELKNSCSALRRMSHIHGRPPSPGQSAFSRSTHRYHGVRLDNTQHFFHHWNERLYLPAAGRPYGHRYTCTVRMQRHSIPSKEMREGSAHDSPEDTGRILALWVWFQACGSSVYREFSIVQLRLTSHRHAAKSTTPRARCLSQNKQARHALEAAQIRPQIGPARIGRTRSIKR